MAERNFSTGDVVQHFKRELCKESELLENPNKYLYIFRRVATHTETGDKLVIYDSMYPPFESYARPYDMFMSEVDCDKYPDVKQQYRLEKITDLDKITSALKEYHDKFMYDLTTPATN